MSESDLRELTERFKALDDGRVWQKVCAAEDWTHPLFRFVLESVMQRRLNLHRKQWEFVVIILALMRRGAIHPQARGVSFGAGREVPLYVISRYVEHLIATDLYVQDTGWNTARTVEGESPTESVLRAAKTPVDPKRLSARHMDMRDLDFEDGEFDFAYSSCAFEHIGERKDFLRHLREVRRVLKPGGVYVMTTEFAFGDKTYPLPRNYKFSGADLLAMVSEAGLAAEPVFDCTVAPSTVNRPRPPYDALGIPRTISHGLPAVILQTDGVMHTSCVLVLEQADQPRESRIRGAEGSLRRLKHQLARQGNQLFREWRPINPNSRAAQQVPEALKDHASYLKKTLNAKRRNPLICTEYLHLPAGNAAFRVAVVGLQRPPWIRFRVLARAPLTKGPGRVVCRAIIKRAQLKNTPFVTLEFTAREDEAYSLVAVAGGPKEPSETDTSINVDVRSAKC